MNKYNKAQFPVNKKENMKNGRLKLAISYLKIF